MNIEFDNEWNKGVIKLIPETEFERNWLEERKSTKWSLIYDRCWEHTPGYRDSCYFKKINEEK